MWLTTTASRLCLNFLGSARNRRERYVGPWFPEPDPLDRVMVDESVSTALLVVLEVLPLPSGWSTCCMRPSRCHSSRLLASSAVATKRPGNWPLQPADTFVDNAPTLLTLTNMPNSSTSSALPLSEAIWKPSSLSSTPTLTVSVSDGDGMAGVARRPVLGADKVARFLLGALRKWRPQVTIEHTIVNTRPGLAIHLASSDQNQVIGIAALEVNAGHIRHIWISMNPDKLTTWNPTTSTHES